MNGAALDDTVRRAVFAAAGELQVAAAETSPVQIAEADLRSALRRGLQMQLGRCVETERRH